MTHGSPPTRGSSSTCSRSSSSTRSRRIHERMILEFVVATALKYNYKNNTNCQKREDIL